MSYVYKYNLCIITLNFIFFEFIRFYTKCFHKSFKITFSPTYKNRYFFSLICK